MYTQIPLSFSERISWNLCSSNFLLIKQVIYDSLKHEFIQMNST